MAERWGALSGTGEVPEELIDQVGSLLMLIVIRAGLTQ